jgi:hypothetical protein
MDPKLREENQRKRKVVNGVLTASTYSRQQPLNAQRRQMSSCSATLLDPERAYGGHCLKITMFWVDQFWKWMLQLLL